MCRPYVGAPSHQAGVPVTRPPLLRYPMGPHAGDSSNLMRCDAGKTRLGESQCSQLGRLFITWGEGGCAGGGEEGTEQILQGAA